MKSEEASTQLRGEVSDKFCERDLDRSACETLPLSSITIWIFQ